MSCGSCSAKVPNREPLLFTTAVQKFNQGAFPKTGGDRFRAAFFRSFLAEQKRTNIKSK